MFSHPALLRELNLTAEHLRRHGEAEWSRRVLLSAEAVRKSGWTEEGWRHFRALFDGDPSLNQARFGPEHLRHSGDEAGIDKANQRLERHRLKLAELGALPTRPKAVGPRQRSPDLVP